MARIRAIKPEFFRHERLYDAERGETQPARRLAHSSAKRVVLEQPDH